MHSPHVKSDELSTVVIAPYQDSQDQSTSIRTQQAAGRAFDSAGVFEHNPSNQQITSLPSNQQSTSFFGRCFSWFSRGPTTEEDASSNASGENAGASGENTGPSEPSIFRAMFDKTCSAVKNFFSSSSRCETADTEHSSSNRRSSAEGGESGPKSSVASSDHRKKRNKEIEDYNDALEAAIKDIKDQTKELPENADQYLDGVSIIDHEEARREIDRALQAARAVRNKGLIDTHQLINELDNVGNSLKTRKKPTDGWFSNKVFDFTKMVGDAASCDVQGFFTRQYKKIDNHFQLNDSWDRAGTFKKIAKFALYDFPGSQQLKKLNAFIHDTSNSSILRGGAAIIAAIAALAIPVISFAARTVVLALAITCQVLVYRKIIPTLAVLGGTIAALVFGGKAAVFAGTIATIAFACSMTGFGSSLVSLAIAAVAYIKLKREKQNTDSEEHKQLQAREARLQEREAELQAREKEFQRLKAAEERRIAEEQATRAALVDLQAPVVVGGGDDALNAGGRS